MELAVREWTPKQLAMIKPNDFYDIQDMIWAMSNTSTQRVNVQQLMHLLEDLESRPLEADQVIVVYPGQVIGLLRELWGNLYVERLIVTTFITKKGLLLLDATYRELSRWLRYNRDGRPRYKTIHPPSSKTMSDRVDNLPLSMVNVADLEKVYESMSVVSKQGIRTAATSIRQLVNAHILFFEAVWGSAYMVHVQTENDVLTDEDQRAFTRLAGILRSRIDYLNRMGNLDDELARLKVQMYVCVEISKRLIKIVVDLSKEKRLTVTKEALDMPVDPYGKSPVTWRDRFLVFINPPSSRDVQMYADRHKNTYVNDTVVNDRANMDVYENYNDITRIVTWKNIARQLIHLEFGTRTWSTQRNWNSLSEAVEQIIERGYIGDVSSVLARILPRIPKRYREKALTMYELGIFKRIHVYARRRALTQDIPERRVGMMALYSARLGLLKQRVSELVDLIYDFGKFLYGGDIGLPEKYADRIQRALESTLRLYRRGAERVIACQLGTAIICKARATGECDTCHIPLCGNDTCTHGHVCDV